MKKFLSLLLALTMAVSLAACGARTAGDPQESQPSTPSVSEPPASAEPEPAPDPTEETPDSAQEPGEEDTPSILVAYFSATGNTKGTPSTCRRSWVPKSMRSSRRSPTATMT